MNGCKFEIAYMCRRNWIEVLFEVNEYSPPGVCSVSFCSKWSMVVDCWAYMFNAIWWILMIWFAVRIKSCPYCSDTYILLTAQICDAVAVAGLLNATLVIPIFHLNSVWRDSRYLLLLCLVLICLMAIKSHCYSSNYLSFFSTVPFTRVFEFEKWIGFQHSASSRSIIFMSHVQDKSDRISF